jgi:glutaryl-CoA dehydrogenase
MGCFGPTVPEQYGGGGLDYISLWFLMMQELERGDSGIRSTASVQGSFSDASYLCHIGNEAQRNKYLPRTS